MNPSLRTLSPWCTQSSKPALMKPWKLFMLQQVWCLCQLQTNINCSKSQQNNFLYNSQFYYSLSQKIHLNFHTLKFCSFKRIEGSSLWRLQDQLKLEVWLNLDWVSSQGEPSSDRVIRWKVHFIRIQVSLRMWLY